MRSRPKALGWTSLVTLLAALHVAPAAEAASAARPCRRACRDKIGVCIGVGGRPRVCRKNVLGRCKQAGVGVCQNTAGSPGISPGKVFQQTPAVSGTATIQTCGDVNGDGIVNIGDALVVAEFDVGIRQCSHLIHPEACDVNGDGACNIDDALRIAQCDVGLISCAFTCGPFTCPSTTSTTTTTTTSTSTTTTSPLLLSTDPYTNPTSQHQTEVEPDTFAFGNTVVSAFQVGRFFDGGASNIGFATSTDGGNSFAKGFLPGTTPFSTPAGIYARVSDASVAFDANHAVWIISYLGIVPAGNTSEVDVLVSRSMDGGLTWGNPVVVKADGDFNDKNWAVCDNTTSSPFYGNCYTEFDDATLGDLIQMSTSPDGGLTWGPALATADGAHGIGGQPLVQPSGRVVVPIVGLDSPVFTISSFISTTGGARV